MSFTISVPSFYSKLPPIPDIGIRLKLERANKHIEELQGALGSFYATSPYKVRTKKDARTREQIIYLTKVDPVPDVISILAGDAIQNIRSALDHLAFRLYAIKNPRKTDDIIYFPIAKSMTTYNSTGFRGKVECFGRDIAKRIDAIKPYKGGDDALWRLHELNKIDKHRLLIPAVSGITFRSLTSAERHSITLKPLPFYTRRGESNFILERLLSWTSSGLPLGPLKKGDILYRGPHLSANEQNNLKFRIEVTFNEVKVDEREPMIQALYLYLRSAERTCRSFRDLLLIHK